MPENNEKDIFLEVSHMNNKARLILFAGTAVAATFIANHFGYAEYNISHLVESYRVAKAANQYVIDPKDIKDKPYTIQVASHINEKEAIEHVEQLRVQEETVFYYPNFVKSQVFFKVCVGRFETKEAAEAYRKDFVRRMDEPFAVSISMFDCPGEDKKATTAQMASAKKSTRGLASVDINAPPIDLKNEGRDKAPIAKNAPATAAEAVKNDVDVQLMNKKSNASMTAKANPVAAVVNATAENVSRTYGLQVAAFPTEELARVEAKKINSHGQEVYFLPAEVNGKTWYRVYVGKFKKYSEAQAFQSVYAETTPGMTIIRKFNN